MKHTNRQTTHATLLDLCRAIARKNVVTITYLDRHGDETVRTIEPTDLRVTDDGDIELYAMCRLRGQARKFALSRLVSYTVHRMAFVLDHEEPTTVAGHVIPFRSTAQLVAHELGRDDFPRYRRAYQPAA